MDSYPWFSIEAMLAAGGGRVLCKFLGNTGNLLKILPPYAVVATSAVQTHVSRAAAQSLDEDLNKPKPEVAAPWRTLTLHQAY